jgi:colicin import membrane protein
MNAIVTIDRILSPETVAAQADILTPAIVFAPGGVEKIIADLEATVRATPRDMTTDAGRKAISSLAYKVARSKTALDDMGKDLVADIKKQSGAIDAERRVIRDRLDALRDEVRGELTAWEALEKRRVEDHEQALVFIISGQRFSAPPTADEILARIADIKATCVRDWQEFSERAEDAATDTLALLDAALAAAIQAEADAAELAELRKMKAEREAADIAASNAAAAAETSRRQAEQEAAREAERIQNAAAEAAQRAEQEAARDIERAEQAARDATAAAALAVENERKRVAAETAATEAATAKREANTKHREKIERKIGEALFGLGFEPAVADVIRGAITAGLIPHVSVTY